MEGLRNWLSFASSPSLSYKGVLFRSAEDERDFSLRARQVRDWCAIRLKLKDKVADVLRSIELKPDVMVGDGADASWNHEHKDVKTTVLRLNGQREKLLGQRAEESVDKLGKLLIFWPDETLDCGAAQFTSNGYFDAGNAPPWDTWFWYAELYNQPPALISWVPDDLIGLVDLAISVNPEQCIKWL